MTLRLGLDLGGTNIKVAVLDETTDAVVFRDSVATRSAEGPRAVIARMIEVGRQAKERYPEITTAGIGVPGLFDSTTGTIDLFPNLPGPWKGQALREPLQSSWGVPVTLINDARAFTLAEGTIGAGRGSSTLVCVTLGTGVGGGIMIGGRLYNGPLGVAGEIAHQTVLPDGPLCGCGNRGCAEALAKAETVAASAGRATIEEVYEGISQGDPACREAVELAAYYLGIALANVVALLGPDRIVIGGGISQAGDLVLDPIRKAVRQRVKLVPTSSISIVAATLGAEAGAIGAALAATQLVVRDR